MFPWNIAKSAEAMFSRWAVKHVLKFLLKKKLGQFILGDLDLDQLEVQLGSGSIQLTDLALNVDYINQKLGSLPVILKEGSVGSLLAKIPWKVRNCQIEVDELELVFVPSARKDLSDAAEPSSSSGIYKEHVKPVSEKFDHDSSNYSSIAVPLDVHEGVKTIAKMVKWLLTSFHIKVKKLIVAYDPYSDKDSVSESNRSLVLRISELEYGTCVSEDNNGRSNSGVDSLLGLSRLTNFIKFQGAVIEFLQMDDVEKQKTQTLQVSPPGSAFSEMSMGGLPSDATIPILTGEGGGFSGNLKLSIPWRNGSLDIHKVDIDVSVDPIDLRLQPSIITWIFCLWQSLKTVDPDVQDRVNDNNGNSVYYSSTSQFHYSNLASTMIGTDRVLTGSGAFSAGFFSQTSPETSRNALLRGSHVIPDWVALSTNLNPNDKVEAEPDLSASIDQFFECFDGLRTSHSALGNSGILNWPCSVFSAITAASTLASGSLLIPSEQQPVETNFKASFSGISVELYLCDKDPKDSRGSVSGSLNNGGNAHHLGAKCMGLHLLLQIRPPETKFEATIKHIELDEYFSGANEAVGSGVLGCESAMYNQSFLIKNLQEEVQDALPISPLLQDLAYEATHSSGFPIHKVSGNNSLNNISYKTTSSEDFVKMNLLKTSSVTPCELTMNMALLSGTKTYSTSFSVKLPPFIFWVNFNLINKLLSFLKQIENSIPMKNTNSNSDFEDERSDERSKGFKSSCPGEMKGTSMGLTTSSSKGGFRGTISLSSARIVLCFPLESPRDLKSYFLWNQFICLDITQASSEECFADLSLRDSNLPPAFSDKVSGSIYLNFENLKMYLIAGSGKDVEHKSVDKHTYFAQEILSVITGTKCFSCIGVLWQNGPVTGPWVAMRARGLATSQDSSRSRTRVTGKGSEFASVTTMGDQEDISSCTQEMILSSRFLLHIRLPSVSVNLTGCQYQLLQHLLCRMIDDFSFVALNASSASTNSIKEEETSTSQTSLLVECNSLEVAINLDKLEGIEYPLQTELSGSWHKLKFHIQKLDLLSVSNTGGIHGCNFFWLGHGEGWLRGSIDELPLEEFLLISCSDSSMRRGDGEGGNALSSGSAGTAIVYLSDPHILQSFTTVVVRGATIIAHGCRLDWSNSLCDFFRLPSENDGPCHNSDHKASSDDSTCYKASFVLNLLDVALSYEPWINNSVNRDRAFESDSNSFVHVGEEIEEHVACILAAASLNLSNQTVPSSAENDFKIRLQDLGLLLSASSGTLSEIMYDVEYLHKAGYVKVGGEALVEAVLRTNCENGLLWELECCDSHISLDTCHDSTSGLVRLAAQLQQLFAPDLQESLVHLQSRWEASQQVDCSNDFINRTDVFRGGSASSPYSVKPSVQGANSSGVIGLMDDICEDAFHFSGKGRSSFDPCESEVTISLDRGHLEEANCTNVSNRLHFPQNVPAKWPIPRSGSESIPTSSPSKDSFPTVIEGYYISGLCTLPEISARNLSINNHNRDSRNQFNADLQIENGGWYKNNSLRVVDDHIPNVTTQPGGKEIPRVCEIPDNNCPIPEDTSKARGRVFLKNIDVRWRMYGGSDWNGSMKNVTTNGGGRDTTVCLELTLSAVDLQYHMYPDDEVRVSALSLSVQDFNLYDRSKDAPWKLVLGYYHSKDHPRESSAKSFKLDLEAVRPDPSTPLEEYRLRLAILPMLLHLDQDQLDFLIRFFEGKESVVDQSTTDVSISKMSSSRSTEFGGFTVAEEALLPFFQKFDIWPIVVRVDYSPRRVDLAAIRRGNYVQLVNLVPWKGIELQLKHVHAVGIYGWSSICETIVGEWLEDISHNQIHKFLRGLPPIRSMFTIGSGAAKLVSLPVKNYKKDQKLLKGIQRGAIAFIRSISLEAIGLGVHLAAGAHDILLQTEHVFTSIPPSVSSPSRSKTKTNIRSNQPRDARQGIQQACESLGDGFGKSASALVGNPLKKYQRGRGVGSVLTSAVRGAPSAALAPASATVRAVHCALLGVRNSLDPEHKKESMEKYLGHAQSPQKN